MMCYFPKQPILLGIVGTIIFEANNEDNPANFIPMVLGHTIVPVLEMRDITRMSLNH